MMMKTIVRSLLLCSTLLFMAACENEPVVSNTPGSEMNKTENLVFDVSNACYTTDLMAGQFYLAGNVYVKMDANNVYVIYNAINDWKIKATHLYVGDCNQIPQTSTGNPIPGKFPLATNNPSGVQQVVYTIAKSGLGDCFCIAAHAEVSRPGQSETAWAKGDNFPGSNWAMFFSICKSNCLDEEQH